MQIPVVTDVGSLAKCPHCQTKIPVRDLLASVVPEAEIVDEEEVEVSDYMVDRQRVYDDKPKPREKFEVPKQLYDGARRRNRKRKSRGKSSRGKSSRSSSSKTSSSNDSSSRESSSQNQNLSNGRYGNGQADNSVGLNGSGNHSPDQQTKNADSVTTSTHSEASRNYRPSQERRSSSKSSRPARSSSPGRRSSDEDDDAPVGVVEIVKFVIGGLIAAPLAYLALLWVLGVDPFGMASTFESVSPSLIPSSLRSEIETEESKPGYAPPAEDSPASLFGTAPDLDEGLPQPSLDPDLVR